MFDHIQSTVSASRKRSSSHRYPRYVIVGALVIGGFAVSFFSILSMLVARAYQVAPESRVIVQMIDSGVQRDAVPPIEDYQLAQWELTAVSRSIRFSGLDLTLGGVYDPNTRPRVVFAIDGVQVGYPVYPDEFGKLTAVFETVVLEPGAHRLEARLSVTTPVAGQIFFVRSAKDAFTFHDAGVSSAVDLKLPDHSQPVRVVQHGSIGSFVKNGNRVKSGGTADLYLYARGEHAMLDAITFSADRALTGFRIDVFQDGNFLESGLFDNSAVLTISLHDQSLRVVQQNSLGLTIVATANGDAEDSPDRLTIPSITARGARSGSVLVSEKHVHLWE